MQAREMEQNLRIWPPGRNAGLTVTNAVWTATALLHRKYPKRSGFERDEIVKLVMELNLTEGEEGSIQQHVRQHSVANRKPQPNRACMLFDPGDGLRRLFRVGDEVFPGKDPTHTHPDSNDLPPQYRDLVQWYCEEWNGIAAATENDPLLALIGTWKDGPGDEYVANLREGWYDRV